jgi:hypothetical protein
MSYYGSEPNGDVTDALETIQSTDDIASDSDGDDLGDGLIVRHPIGR